MTACIFHASRHRAIATVKQRVRAAVDCQVTYRLVSRCALRLVSYVDCVIPVFLHKVVSESSSFTYNTRAPAGKFDKDRRGVQMLYQLRDVGIRTRRGEVYVRPSSDRLVQDAAGGK